MDPAAVLAQLQQLIAQFEAVVEAVSGLPSSDATGSMVERLQEAAEAEMDVLVAVNDSLGLAASGDPNRGTSSPAQGGSPLDEMDAFIEESEALLEQVTRTTKVLLDDDPEENLADVKNFDGQYRSLLVSWDAFHQDYQDWRKIDGGCDRTDVLQSLDQFNLRIGELGRRGAASSPVQLSAAHVHHAGRSGGKRRGSHPCSTQLLAPLHRRCLQGRRPRAGKCR